MTGPRLPRRRNAYRPELSEGVRLLGTAPELTDEESESITRATVVRKAICRGQLRLAIDNTTSTNSVAAVEHYRPSLFERLRRAWRAWRLECM